MWRRERPRPATLRLSCIPRLTKQTGEYLNYTLDADKVIFSPAHAVATLPFAVLSRFRPQLPTVTGYCV